jgi:hypothetical protein
VRLVAPAVVNLEIPKSSTLTTGASSLPTRKTTERGRAARFVAALEKAMRDVPGDWGGANRQSSIDALDGVLKRSGELGVLMTLP